MQVRVLLTAALIALSASALIADVRTDQKTQVQFGGMLGRMMNMFGGKAAREGMTSTIAVKGNRKVTMTDSMSQIIDLNEEKIYDLDHKKQNYKVTTFAEMRRRMEEAQRKAAEDARKSDDEPKESGKPDDPQVEIDFDVKNTGATKSINGFDTKQSVVTITVREKGKTLEQAGGMVMTSDMWLAPTMASMKEITDFDMRYAQKLYGGLAGVSADQMAAVMALYPMMKQALGRMSSEAAKIQGTAISTTLTFDAVKPAQQVQAEREPEAKPRGLGLGGMLGGLAKKVAKKEGDDKPRSTFMTATTEVLKMSNDVAPADLAIPAGFKESK
ncbi:MAG TPA: hypothetical protein VNJ02_18415 [Vicinamibacterales bacterium]|nr:hypothetical protein [Vicinamibacterales bacterium]